MSTTWQDVQDYPESCNNKEPTYDLCRRCIGKCDQEVTEEDE